MPRCLMVVFLAVLWVSVELLLKSYTWECCTGFKTVKNLRGVQCVRDCRRNIWRACKGVE